MWLFSVISISELPQMIVPGKAFESNLERTWRNTTTTKLMSQTMSCGNRLRSMFYLCVASSQDCVKRLYAPLYQLESIVTVSIDHIKRQQGNPGEIANWWRAFAALPVNLNLVALVHIRQLIISNNLNSRGPNTFFQPPHICDIHTQKQIKN